MKGKAKGTSRSKTIDAISSRLSMPRVQISVILAVTALTGFIVSAILLRVGVTTMALRYLIAVVAAYAGFLIFLRIWLWLQSDEPLGSVDVPVVDGVVIPDINIGGGSVSSAKDFEFGGGGDFAGAGAGSGWSDEATPVPLAPSVPNSSSASISGSGSTGIGDLDIDLDDGAALLIVIAIAALILGALIYVVWIAPVLLAELVIDAAVVGSLYKPVKNIERRHWLSTALRKTGIPAVIIAVLAVGAGFVMQAAVPEALTAGEFLRSVI